MNKTIIDVLDEFFDGRDYVLDLLENEEILQLSEALTQFALNYNAPTRKENESRLYLGGTPWNIANAQLGASALAVSPIANSLQTLCLVNDSVICHDLVTDTLANLTYDFIPNFFKSIDQGDLMHLGLSSKDNLNENNLRESLCQKLNPTLRTYDQSRELIKRGFFIPISTLGAVNQYKEQIKTQFRHSLKDQELFALSLKSSNIAISDNTINVVISPQGTSQEIINKLKLHYGLVHFYRCLSVAFVGKADFTPSDDFGENYMHSIGDTFAKEINKKSRGKYIKDKIAMNIHIPIVEKFSIEDIVRIRLNEDVFDEARNILKHTAEKTFSTLNSEEDYLMEIHKYNNEALDIWKSKIKCSSKKSLFKDSALTAGTGIGFTTSLITADSKIATIGALAALPGFLSGVVDLIKSGTSPDKLLRKITRKYKW